MTQNGNAHGELGAGEGLSRDDLLRRLGIDPSVITSTDPVCEHVRREAETDFDRCRLSDAEWQAIVPLLPAEPRRANTMANRDFVDAVLVAHARRSWTDYSHRGPNSDAVRRRFGRWAHQNVWQTLAASDLGLSSARQAQFAGIAHRAQVLSR